MSDPRLDRDNLARSDLERRPDAARRPHHRGRPHGSNDRFARRAPADNGAWIAGRHRGAAVGRRHCLLCYERSPERCRHRAGCHHRSDHPPGTGASTATLSLRARKGPALAGPFLLRRTLRVSRRRRNTSGFKSPGRQATTPGPGAGPGACAWLRRTAGRGNNSIGALPQCDPAEDSAPHFDAEFVLRGGGAPAALTFRRGSSERFGRRAIEALSGLVTIRTNGEEPMTKEDDYRQSAAETMELAGRAPISDKGRLLALAEAWLDLAERARCGHPTRAQGA